MISTKNFHPDTDTKLACTCGHPKCDKRSVKQDVLNRVQLIREDCGRPLTITSGGRCKYHDKEKHKKTPGDHFNCVAVDIAVCGGIERMELVDFGLARGATAIGVYQTFVHLGWRDDEPVLWVGA